MNKSLSNRSEGRTSETDEQIMSSSGLNSEFIMRFPVGEVLKDGEGPEDEIGGDFES